MDAIERDCLALFDEDAGGRLPERWQAGVLRQRTKTVKAGPMVYVDCYPVWDTQTARAAREEAARASHRRAQERINARNARRALDVLVNANFGAGDLILTLTYPHDGDRARRDVVNYLARIRRLRARRGLPPLRYVYVTEETRSERYGVRYHHHVIMGGDGLTRDEAEACWTRRHGGICNARRAQPTRMHLTGFSRYLTADKRAREGRNPQTRAMRRRWAASQNLIRPQPTVADRKISVRRAGRIAEAAADFDRARALLSRAYPGCALLEVEAYRSPWAAGVYIRAVLRREEREGAGRGCAEPVQRGV